MQSDRQQQEPTEATPERLNAAPDRRRNPTPSGEGGCQFIRASANYVRLHLTRGTCDVRETITTMEARLPPDRFMRIHRSYIVNLGAVLELYPAGGGEYLLVLRSGRELPVGTTYPPLISAALQSARLPRFGGHGGI